MTTRNLRNLTLAVGSTALLVGCNGLGKMIKKENQITYDAKPNPLEMIGDSVMFTASAKYPAKVFAKKATVTVTPVIKYSTGGEKALKQVVLVGDKATGSGQKISYDKGGSFTYTSEKIAYEPGMKNSVLELRAQGAVKSKTKDFTPVKIADGTIVTSLLVRQDQKGIYAKDAFVKTVPANQTASIYYLINKSDVRASEMKSEEVKNLQSFISNNINNPWYEFKDISVSAYSSPDGEQTLNANLAQDRAKTGAKALMTEFNKNKNKDQQFGKNESSYKTQTTAEDWDGFKQLMESSSIADKDLILRVLTMYPDGDQREKEIKNLSKTYTEVSEKILPKLRRSVLTVNAEKKSRTDEMLKKMSTSNPDSLSAEELLYSATLTNDINTKAQIYKSAEQKYPNDWRASNNYGVALLAQNKVDEAKQAFNRAEKNANNNPILMNQLGIIEAKNGNRAKAMEYFDKAGSSPEVSYNKGIINIQNGQYFDAVSNFGSNKDFNKALAELLNGNKGVVASTLEGSADKDNALSYYLLAVSAARGSNTTEALKNLKTAVEKDGSLKAMAKDDAEFIKMRDNAEFKALLN